MRVFIRALGSLVFWPFFAAFFFIGNAFGMAIATERDYGPFGLLGYLAVWFLAFPLAAIVNAFYAMAFWIEWICTGDY